MLSTTEFIIFYNYCSTFFTFLEKNCKNGYARVVLKHNVGKILLKNSCQHKKLVLK